MLNRKIKVSETWKEQIVYIHTNQVWIDLFRRNPYLNTTWPNLFQLPNAEILSYILNNHQKFKKQLQR